MTRFGIRCDHLPLVPNLFSMRSDYISSFEFSHLATIPSLAYLILFYPSSRLQGVPLKLYYLDRYLIIMDYLSLWSWSMLQISAIKKVSLKIKINSLHSVYKNRSKCQYWIKTRLSQLQLINFLFYISNILFDLIFKFIQVIYLKFGAYLCWKVESITGSLPIILMPRRAFGSLSILQWSCLVGLRFNRLKWRS